MNKAIVVGSINMDIVAYVKEHPQIGETILGRDVKYYPGGKGANQAVACRRLGCKTVMLGRVGNDVFGERLLAFQKQEGIDITGVKCLENIATGMAFITVAESSENSIIVVSGANMVWDDDFVGDFAVETGDIALAQFEIPDEAIRKAFEKAKDYGATTILNPAPVRAIDSGIRDVTDLMVVNEHELAQLSGYTIDVDDDASVFRAAERVAEDGFRSLIVTLGGKGVRLLADGRRHAVAAREVVAVDTTGAGDTFVGGLAAGLLSGMDLVRAAELGNFAASISVTRPGAASSIPNITEVKRMLRSAAGGYISH